MRMPSLGARLYSLGEPLSVKVLNPGGDYTSELWLFSPGVPRYLGVTSYMAGSVVEIGTFPAGTELVFGVVVQDTDQTFKLGPGERNPDGLIHGAVTRLDPERVDVGFEDQDGGGDLDYDDAMFRIIGAVFLPDPGVPFAIEKTAGDEVSVPSGSTHTLTVTVEDFFGNPVSGVTVVFASETEGASVAPLSAVTNASGQASTVLTLRASPGVNEVEVSLPGFPAVESQTFVVTGAPFGVSGVTPRRITESALSGGEVSVSVSFEDASQAESVAAVDLVLGDWRIRNPVSYASGSSAVSFLLSSSEVGGHYGRYSVFVVPYGSGGMGTPVPTDFSFFVAGQPQEAWIADLRLTVGGASQVIQFGSAVNALEAVTVGEDALMPPPPSESVPFLAFQRAGVELQRDILSVSPSGRLSWDLRVHVPSGSSGVLSWEGLADLLPYYDNVLLEREGKAYDLRRHPDMSLPPGTHVFQLVAENSRPKPLSGTYSLGLGGWMFFSVPGSSANATPESLALDGFNTVYTWDGEAQQFVLVRPGESLVPVQKGYILNRALSSPGPSSFTWEVNVDEPRSRIAEVVLRPGWNLIGVPRDGSAKAIFGVPNDYIVEWTPSGYQTVTATTLEPFRSYWVYNNGAVETVILAQSRHIGTMLGNLLDGTDLPGTPLAVLDADWSFSLDGVSSSGVRRRVTLGSDPRAKEGLDSLDAPLPPSFVGDQPEFYVVSRGSSVRMRRSILPIFNRQAEWALVAELPESGRIEWEPIRLPEGYRLHLRVGGRVYDLRHAGVVELSSGRHELRVSYGWKAPDVDAVFNNFPNPFNPETWIPFQLREDAVVTVTIYDTKGLVVRRLDLGYREKGYYTRRSEAAYWDGRNALGEAVSSGVYFYELRAGSYRAVRRMLLLK